MSLVVGCQAEGCEATVEADWATAGREVRDFAIRDLDYGDMVYVYLPAGWGADLIDEYHHVLHCPEHRSDSAAPARPGEA